MIIARSSIRVLARIEVAHRRPQEFAHCLVGYMFCVVCAWFPDGNQWRMRSGFGVFFLLGGNSQQSRRTQWGPAHCSSQSQSSSWRRTRRGGSPATRRGATATRLHKDNHGITTITNKSNYFSLFRGFWREGEAKHEQKQQQLNAQSKHKGVHNRLIAQAAQGVNFGCKKIIIFLCFFKLTQFRNQKYHCHNCSQPI